MPVISHFFPFAQMRKADFSVVLILEDLNNFYWKVSPFQIFPVELCTNIQGNISVSKFVKMLSPLLLLPSGFFFFMSLSFCCFSKTEPVEWSISKIQFLYAVNLNSLCILWLKCEAGFYFILQKRKHRASIASSEHFANVSSAVLILVKPSQASH